MGGVPSPRALLLRPEDVESRRSEQGNAGRDAASGRLSRAKCPRRPLVLGCPAAGVPERSEAWGPGTHCPRVSPPDGLAGSISGARSAMQVGPGPSERRGRSRGGGLPGSSQVLAAPEKRASVTLRG